MPVDVDVAIVGGGPAGAATAHYLAAQGRSVLVCEKKAFPREKTCGDGLTPRAIKMLEQMGLRSELDTWERVRGLRVHKGGRTHELPFPNLQDFCSYGLVKPRRNLDQIVLERAQAGGAKVLYETEVLEPLFDKGTCVGVRARRDGQSEDVHARFVVCAEGSATRFTHALGRTRIDGYPMGYAIRQYFTSPMEHSGWFEAYLDVRSDADLLPGYGWVFPVGDGTVNAGVGLLSTFGDWRSVNLHRLQHSFISMLPQEQEINMHTVCSKPRAGRLFMGGSVWPAHGPGFVLAGDAAGMINPCNGEGIAYGYETGYIAGRHIDEALKDGRSESLEGYSEELKDEYGPYYRLGRAFVNLLGHPVLMDMVVSAAMRSKSVMSFAFTMMCNLSDAAPRSYEQKAIAFWKKVAEIKP